MDDFVDDLTVNVITVDPFFCIRCSNYSHKLPLTFFSAVSRSDRLSRVRNVDPDILHLYFKLWGMTNYTNMTFEGLFSVVLKPIFERK